MQNSITRALYRYNLDRYHITSSPNLSLYISQKMPLVAIADVANKTFDYIVIGAGVSSLFVMAVRHLPTEMLIISLLG